MREEPELTRAELLDEIETTWAALNVALDQLTDEQMIALRDAAGWNVRDHLTHLAVWENSVLSLLQGRPRHEGLGITAAEYLGGTFDSMNEAIRHRLSGMTPQEARDDLREIHNRMLARLSELSEADLLQPYRHYLPHEPGEGDGPPVINVVYGNTAQHFAEHLEWIETLVGSPAQS